MRGKENLHKLLSLFLAFIMLFTIMPNTALAADNNIRTITLSSNISLANADFTSEIYNINGNLINTFSTENETVTWKLDSTNISALSIALNAYNKTEYYFKGYTVNNNKIFNSLDGYSVYNDPIDSLVIAWENITPSPLIPEPGWDIVAVFEEKPHDPENATYKVSADTEDILKGSVKCEYRGKQDKADKWRLTATASDNMQFDYWELSGADDSFTENPLDLEVTENRDYIAHFKPFEISLGDNISINNPTSFYTTDKICNGKPVIGNKFYGLSGIFNIPFSLPTAISNNSSQIEVDLYAGTSRNDECLASHTFETDNLTADDHYFEMLAKSIPSALDSLTVSVKLSDTNGSRQAVIKTYSLSDVVGKYTLNKSWAFIPSPDSIDEGAARQDVCTADPGPFITDATAFLNLQSDMPDLFLSGPTGIFTWNTDKTAVELMDISSLKVSANSKGVFAIGGTDPQNLVALVQSDVQTEGTVGGGYYICTYDETAWKLLENTQFGDIRSNGSIHYPEIYSKTPKEALIFAENNIWLPLKHWDGSAWSANDVTYKSFYQASGTSGFAGTEESGLYQYKDSKWTRILEDEFTKKADIISGNTKGKLLVTPEKNFLNGTYLVNTDTQTVTKVDFPVNIVKSDIKNIQLDDDDSLYIMLNGTQYSSITSTYVLKLENDEWIMQDITSFRAEGDKPYTVSGKIRADGVNAILNPSSGINIAVGTNHGGIPGSLYLLNQTDKSVSTITFDANGGTIRGNAYITGKTNSPIDSNKVPTASKDGYYFVGWYYDKACTKEWNEIGAVIPDSDLVLYAKLSPKSSGGDFDEIYYHRKKALAALKDQYEKYEKNQRNYSSSGWQQLVSAYNDGLQKIKSAKPSSGDYPENNLIAELNAALNAMSSITPEKVSSIEVAVSMDANTLGLGYIIKPTLVSCDDMTRASQVITDLLSENGYKWENTGKIESAFYLSGVYDVDQSKVEIPKYILKHTGEDSICYDDKNNKTLSEFNYFPNSGWMYSMGDNRNDKYPTFPGIGSSDWHLSNGEVMRWQFTVYGYGSDLNSDNSAWGSKSIVPQLGNKNELTWAVAVLRDKYTDEVLEANSDYNSVIKVLNDPEATQSKIDKAYKSLKGIKFDETSKPSTGGSTSGNGKEGSAVVNPKITVNKKGEALGLISSNDLKAAFDKAKKEQANILVIAPEGIEKATKVSLELNRDSLIDLKDDKGMAVKIKTGIGTLSLPNSALNELYKKSDSKVTFNIEKNAENSFSINLSADNKPIEKLSSGIKTSIPVKNGDVMVLLKADGTEEIIKKSIVESKTAYALLDGSATIKIIVNSKAFTDVTDKDWYSSAVGFASSHELFKGTSDANFSPNSAMSRAMLATVLYRLESAVASRDAKFTDIDKNGYYANAISWAASSGIVNGVSENSFAPNKEITREQLATMLYRYANKVSADTSAKGDLKKFSDSSKISSFAEDAITWAVGSGIMSGKSSTTIDASGKATRAEVAAVLQRFVSNLVK